MKNFPITANVEFQGNKVLRYQETKLQAVHYQAIGFTKPEIEIIDYRQSGQNAIQQVLETGDSSAFPVLFNTPASVDIKKSKNKITVLLSEPTDLNPDYMLWAAIGIEKSIPAYDYTFWQIDAIDDTHYAFLSVYKYPTSFDSSGS